MTNTLSASKPASVAAPWHYWLRTPYSGDSYGARCVSSSGALNHRNADNGHVGVRPLCNLSSDILENRGDGTHYFGIAQASSIMHPQAAATVNGVRCTQVGSRLKASLDINDVLWIKEMVGDWEFY